MVGLIGSLRGSSYEIPNSLRFRSSNSSYLSRTPTVVGDRKTWTWSGWVKLGSLTGVRNLLGTVPGQYDQHYIGFNSDGALTAYFETSSGTTKTRWTTTSVFRDPSAWYHIVVVYDTTQSTVTNMCKFYVNGLLQTITIDDVAATYVTQNANGYINSANLHTIGSGLAYYNGYYFDGYMTEVNFIDGQALGPSSFGKISGSTGVWSPKKYTGTYGINGFYLKFTDNSAATSAAIGKDYSGNYNSWTPNNISLIAGSTYDSMIDSPTPYGDVLQYFEGKHYPYNALNFRSNASTLLSRTATLSNLTTWTWSGWVKRNSTGVQQTLFSAGQSATYPTYSGIDFLNDNLRVFLDVSGSVTSSVVTTSTFTDTSAWYHVALRYDSTQAVAANRVTIYVNGVAQAASGTYPAQNAAFYQNQALSHVLGAGFNGTVAGFYFNGYLADINFIDGQALDASSFGETVDGVWKPKTYSGTYGTNGFYLKFNDNSAATATTLGKDSAGSNNWTPTNLATTDVTSTDITSYNIVNPNYGLQFRSSASTYLNRANASNGNRQTWTWSGWVKRGIVNTQQHISYVGSSNTYFNQFYFNADNTIGFHERISGGVGSHGLFTTNNTFSDTSTWYHVAFVWDTTQASQENRIKLFVNNGLQSVVWTTYPGLNYEGWRNTTVNTLIGVGATSYFDGYLAEVNFIDGQALTPSSFGETIDGTWVPKTYSGTYGTNGFYLNFADRSAMTAAAIGNDASSNSNNWTPNNFVASDAIDYNATGARGNYATLNAVDWINSTGTLTDGNLGYLTAYGNVCTIRATIAVSSGKWYWETLCVSSGGTFADTFIVGVLGVSETIVDNTITWYAKGYGYNGRTGGKSNNSTSFTAYGSTYASGDLIGIALDMDNGTITFYKNNVSQGVAFTGLSGTFAPAYSDDSYASYTTVAFNFGQRPFAYTPPTGFLALNSHNLPTPAITNGAAYMAATTYTGNGTTLNVSNQFNNVSFKPDLVWIKRRSGATDHALYDSVRGVTKDLVSNSAAAETTQTTGLLTFNDNGFSIGSLAKLNTNAATYVAWGWKAGGTTVSNTAGTITSQVNAGTDQGFSVVSYTGTGVNATVGHGLGVAPKMVITKGRSSPDAWFVWHTAIANTEYLALISTAAKATATNIWNSSSPTSTNISIGTNTDINGIGRTYIAYCFAEIAGYSKFGSYTGNGSADGPFVYCGFLPKWVMIRSTAGDGPGGTRWIVIDSSRDTANPTAYALSPNFAIGEIVIADWKMDFVSDGFKIRSYSSNDREWNYPSSTYIFAAFAEVPFKYSLAR